MKNQIVVLVDWGMGALLIGVFAVVCVVRVLVVYNMVKGSSKK